MVEDRLLNWFGAVEHVPDSVIREITRVKLIDHHYENIVEQIEGTNDEATLAKLLIKLQHLTDMKLQIVGSINDTFGDATDAVKAEFRKIEHESQVFDPKSESRKNKDAKNEDSPGKRNKEGPEKKAKVPKRRLPPTKPEKEQKQKEQKTEKRQKREEKKQSSSDSNDKEETYCFCKQVSYGHMICCDNGKCEIGWFHFSCVGLQHKPKGKWFCTDSCKLTTRPNGGSRGRKRKDSDHDM